MKATLCDKCQRNISNNNYKKHSAACDGTYFEGPYNPSRQKFLRKSDKSPEEIYNIRLRNIEKARSVLLSTPSSKKGILKYSEEEVFSINGPGRHLVKKLFLSKVKYECVECGTFQWKHNPITLELDHINGNNKDNRIENLRLLCPNCHSQTHTYKNKEKRGFRKVSDEMILSVIPSCENIRQVLLAVGLQDQGANYARVKKIIQKYNINLKYAPVYPHATNVLKG